MAASVVAVGVYATISRSKETLHASGRVAYVVDGNLIIKELPDGEPRQITYEGNVSIPIWSATGEWLSYNTASSNQGGEGGAGIANAGTGDSREVERPVVWAPTRDYLVTSGSKFDELIVTLPDGTLIREIDSSTGLSGILVWTSDNEGVTYLRLLEGSRGAETRLLAMNTGSDELLYTSQSEIPRLFGWSSDGQYLFFSDSGSLKILSLPDREVTDTGINVFLFTPEDELMQQPGGSSILVVEATARDLWQGKQIGLLEPATGAFRRLTQPDMAAMHPRWSPDGEQIAYVASPARQSDTDSPSRQETEALLADRHIWIMDADGSNKRRLTSEPRYRDGAPEWTADGGHLIFARVDLEFPDQAPSLWALDISGRATIVVEEMSYSLDRQEDIPQYARFLGTLNRLYDFHE
jgi:Tol biopolymer transport system component